MVASNRISAFQDRSVCIVHLDGELALEAAGEHVTGKLGERP